PAAMQDVNESWAVNIYRPVSAPRRQARSEKKCASGRALAEADAGRHFAPTKVIAGRPADGAPYAEVRAGTGVGSVILPGSAVQGSHGEPWVCSSQKCLYMPSIMMTSRRLRGE